MEIIRSLEQLPAQYQHGAVSIGNFDGVHRGHALLIDRLRHWAKQVGGPAIVFTFDPHPVRILRPEMAPPPLTWTERKADLLAQQGVDLLVAYPATAQMLAMSHDAFFQSIIVQRLAARAMVEGPNFLFGKDRLGNIDELKRLCRDAQMELEIVDGLHSDSSMVSSSRIRSLIKQGDIDAAREMLTEPYRIRGLVTHGDGRGAQLGFPTANIGGIDTLVPGPGVYGGRAIASVGTFSAAIHVGPNPTFGDASLKVECHLLDFDGSLYGQPLEVEFHTRIRDVYRFDSADQLLEQIKADVHAVRAWTKTRARSAPIPNQPNAIDKAP